MQKILEKIKWMQGKCTNGILIGKGENNGEYFAKKRGKHKKNFEK